MTDKQRFTISYRSVSRKFDFYLFNDVFFSFCIGYITWDSRTIVNYEAGRMWERSWPILSYYPSIWVDGVSESTETSVKVPDSGTWSNIRNTSWLCSVSIILFRSELPYYITSASIETYRLWCDYTKGAYCALRYSYRLRCEVTKLFLAITDGKSFEIRGYISNI